MRPLFASLLSGLTLLTGCGLLINLDGLSGGSDGGPASSSGSDMVSSSGKASTTGSAKSSSSGGGSSSGSASASGSGVTSGSTSGSGSGASSSSGSSVPPAKPPVAITIAGGALDGGTLSFKIDGTEVTAAQYLAFTKSFQPTAANQRERCTWNQSVLPNTAPANDAGVAPNAACSTYDLQSEATADPNSPVRCINWCQAAAYCAWAGGWMCHGNEAGLGYQDEWQNACQGGPANKTYPYGDSFQAGICVDSSTSGLEDVASKAMCVGGFAGLYDMSGNVGEWLDCGCEYDDTDPTKTSAYVGGGSYKETENALACNPARTAPLISFNTDIGARCCYPP